MAGLPFGVWEEVFSSRRRRCRHAGCWSFAGLGPVCAAHTKDRYCNADQQHDPTWATVKVPGKVRTQHPHEIEVIGQPVINGLSKSRQRTRCKGEYGE